MQRGRATSSHSISYGPSPTLQQLHHITHMTMTITYGIASTKQEKTRCSNRKVNPAIKYSFILS